MNERLFLLGTLIIFGAGWGLTMPLTKMAVSTGHQYFGLIFWQLIFIALVLFVLTRFQRKPLKMNKNAWFLCLVIAIAGTILPNSVSYSVAPHLSSGVMSVIISLVPMFAFPIALIMGTEAFSAPRLLGLGFGLLAVFLMVAPELSLPGAGVAFFVVLGAIAPICCGFEGNFVAKFGLYGLDPVQVILVSSVIGIVLTAPLAIGSGQFIDLRQEFGIAEWALLASSVLHGLVYSGYVWLVGRAGPVFSAQISYLVTIFGFIWAMLLLGETYSVWIWGALVFMLFGLFLVQPKKQATPEQA